MATALCPGSSSRTLSTKKKGIAVRQKAHDAGDVDHAVFRECGRRVGSRRDRPGDLIEQPPRQGVVGLMSGPVSDHEPVEVEAQQSQVADHVENLVPHTFVGIAQGVADDARRAEDQEIGRRRPSPDTGGAEGGGFRFQQERAAGRQLMTKCLGRQGKTEALGWRSGESRP